MSKKGFIYILTNKSNSTFYIGVTSNLFKRIFQHTEKIVDSFTSKYNLNKLVYYEFFDDIQTAIKREKQLKNWHREWKLNLIKQQNPQLEDLTHTLRS